VLILKKLFFIFFVNIIITLSIYCNTLNDILDKYIRFNNWAEAKTKLEEYIKQNPTDSYAYSLYAGTLNELKLYDEVIISLKNAINYENSVEKKGELYFNLGNAYYNKNSKEVSLENNSFTLLYDRINLL